MVNDNDNIDEQEFYNIKKGLRIIIENMISGMSSKLSKTKLSNNTDFNNYIKGTNNILSRLIILSSNNVQNEVKKSQTHLDYSQYLRYKAYRAKVPRLQPPPKQIITTISSNSNDAILVAADGDPPVPNVVDNCWGYTNNGTPSNKINWYFYADGGFQLNPPSTYKFSDLECFYFVVKLNNTDEINKKFNKPWITIYSQPENDGNDALWYRSKWNYTGFYQDGTNNLLESGTYVFYVGNYESLHNKTKLDIYPKIDIGSYIPQSGILTTGHNNTDPENDGLWLIAINTDSSKDTGVFNLCVKEVGYKIKNIPLSIIQTVA